MLSSWPSDIPQLYQSKASCGMGCDALLLEFECFRTIILVLISYRKVNSSGLTDGCPNQPWDTSSDKYITDKLKQTIDKGFRSNNVSRLARHRINCHNNSFPNKQTHVQRPVPYRALEQRAQLSSLPKPYSPFGSCHLLTSQTDSS